MSKSLGRVLAVGALAAAGTVSSVHADIISYEAFMDGAAEASPTGSPGTGHALIDVDTTLHTMRVRVDFTGLVAANTACHIHSATAAPFTGTAGVATTTPTFTGFPGGQTAGSYDHLFDMTLASSYNPAFVTARGSVSAAESFLFASFDTGQAYINLHSSTFPGGEIRGFLRPVPAPGASALLLTLGGAFGLRRRRA